MLRSRQKEENMNHVCEFDRLITKSVPHLHEKIFFSLDYESFKKCLEVSKSWNDLLTSEHFLSRGKSLFCEDIQKDLVLAAEEGKVVMIKRVLSKFMIDINFIRERYSPERVGGEVYYFKDGKVSPLISAALHGHNDVVQLLLDKGAEPNLSDQNGNTALLYAAFRGHLDVVQLLLNRGADVNMADYYGTTPLHWAAEIGHKHVVKLLLDRGAEPNKENRNGETPLIGAAKGKKDIVQLLLDSGAEPNIPNHQTGMTPLHWAAWRGHKDVVQLLLKRGADPNIRTLYRETPLHYARSSGHMDIVDMLTDWDA